MCVYFDPSRVLSFPTLSLRNYLKLRSFIVQDKHQSVVIVCGLVILIAAYHYVRIFNSGVDAYEYSTGSAKLIGVPFKDVYRYIEWLLIVLLLLAEFFLVMKLNDDGFNSKSWPLGLAAALLDLLYCANDSLLLHCL